MPRKKRTAISSRTAYKKKKSRHLIELSEKRHFHWITCTRCSASILNTESKGLCCGSGSKTPVPIIQIPHVPDELMQIYANNKHIRTHSRMYNNLFSMSAMGTTGGFERLNGPCNLILKGRTYHKILHGKIFFSICTLFCK